MIIANILVNIFQLYFKHQNMTNILITKKKKDFYVVYIFFIFWVCFINMSGTAGKFRSHCSQERKEPRSLKKKKEKKTKKFRSHFSPLCLQIFVFCVLNFFWEPRCPYALLLLPP